jgi:hypothetical protein
LPVLDHVLLTQPLSLLVVLCAVHSNPSTCKFTYTIRLGKGPHKFEYLLGVHGKSRSAAQVPFKVRMEYGNFNSQAKNYNPFAIDYSRASQPVPASALGPSIALLALLLGHLS